MRQPGETDAVVLLYLVVVGLIGEGHRQHTLLLQIGLMDAGKTLGQYHFHIQESRLHGGMFAAGTLAVVVLCHDDARQSFLLIGFSGAGHFHIFSAELAFHFICLAVESVYGSHEQVVGDVLKMAAELQPRTSHGDMVCSAFSLGLDEQGHVLQVVAVPGRKGHEPLQTDRVGADDDLDVFVCF